MSEEEKKRKKNRLIKIHDFGDAPHAVEECVTYTAAETDEKRVTS